MAQQTCSHGCITFYSLNIKIMICLHSIHRGSQEPYLCVHEGTRRRMRPRGRGRWHRGDKLHWRSHQCSRCSHRRSTHLHRRSDSHHACHGMSHHSDMHWASARTRPHFLCSIDLKEKKKVGIYYLKMLLDDFF